MESTEILDYPAAHSMDTTWFAVDAEGYIAMFDTGEGGAVPEDALRGEDGLDILLEEIAKDRVGKLIKVDTPGMSLLSELTWEELNKRAKEPGLAYNVLLLLASDRAIPILRVEEIEDNYIVQFAGDPIIVYLGKCQASDLQKLIDNKQVLAGKSIYWDFDRHIASLCGLYEYEHNSHSLIPYNRRYIPQYPLKLENLPERLQTKIIEAGIDRVKFAESELVQPLEHTPCNAWGNTDYWIDTQGVEHTPENQLRNTWNPVNKTWIDEDGVEYHP